MQNTVLFYLFVLLWAGGVCYHFYQLCRQWGTAGAADFVYRMLFRAYPLTVYLNGGQSRQLVKLFLLVKGGELLGLVLFLRLFWVNWWGEVFLFLLLLGTGIWAFHYLAMLRNGKNGIQCIYPLADDYGVYELVLGSSGPAREWVGTTLAELDLRRKELLVLSIARAGKVVVFPKGPEVLLAGDRLLVFGKTATLPVVPPGGFGPEEEGS